MDDWADVLITLAAYLIIAAVGALVLAAAWLLTNKVRPPWLPIQRLRQVSYAGIGIFVVFVTSQFVPLLMDETLRKAGFFDWLYGVGDDPAMRQRQALWSLLFALPLVLALVVLGVQQFRVARLPDMGLTSVRAGKNLAVGYAAWLFVTPVALLVLSLTVFVTPTQWVDEHAISNVGKQALALSEWIALVVVAVVLAPVVEEIVFRGLLLQWQLRASWEAQAALSVCALFFAAQGGVHGEAKPYNPWPVVFVLAMLPGVFLVPFLRARRQMSRENEAKDTVEPISSEESADAFEERLTALHKRIQKANQPGLALFVNGLLFAALHSTVWPSPIPLLLLGVALAWVTYRTSSLVGAITVHALFNGVAALELVLHQLWRY